MTALFLTGCRNRTVVGAWQGERARLEFSADGNAKGEIPVGPLTVEFTGRYRFDNNGLTLIDFTSPALGMIPPGFRDAASFAFPKTVDYQVSWTDRGELVLSGGGLLTGTYRPAAPKPDPDAKTSQKAAIP